MTAFLRRAARRLAFALLRRAYSSDPRSMARNGELWLIRRLGSGPLRLVDVGYNHGAYARAFLDIHPAGQVLGVEPVPEFHASASLTLPANVTLANVALSDEADEIVLYKKGGGANASPNRPRVKDFARLSVPAVTGDALIAAQGFGAVDLIKIDTDGYDLQALRGFSATVDACRPVIQFEFSRFWLDTRSRMRDAFAFFEGRDYALGRLTPRGVDYLDYHVELEVYALSCNMVAVPNEKRARF